MLRQSPHAARPLLHGALLALAACAVDVDGAGSRPAGPSAVSVGVLAVVPVDVPVTAEALATVIPDARIEVRSEAAGQVSTVSFDDGERVGKGAELMRLRDAAWRADLARTQAEHTLAVSELERAQALFDRDRLSTAELQAAQARADLAKADLDGAREALRRTVVHTPFAGRLGRRLVEPGDVVDTTSVITTLVDDDPLFAELALPERHASWLQLGQPVSLSTAAWPEQRFPGTVSFVAPEVDPTTRTLVVRAELDDTDGRLAPGMTARAEVTLAAPEPRILVPSEAVTTRATGPMVWVVDAEDRAEARPITLGPRRPELVVVTSGLQAGERVVVRGIVRVRSGVALDPQPVEASAYDGLVDAELPRPASPDDPAPGEADDGPASEDDDATGAR